MGHSNIKAFRINTRLILSFFIFGLLTALSPQMVANSSPYYQSESTGEANKKLTPALQGLAAPTIVSSNSPLQADIQSLPAEGPGSLIQNSNGETLVYIRVQNDVETHVQDLLSSGAKITHTAEDYNVITAFVAAENLRNVAHLSSVQNISEVREPFTSSDREETLVAANPTTIEALQTACSPGIVSEGDEQLRAAEVRANFGVNGSGVIVGALSDSFDRASNAVTNATQDISSGDLPGPGNPCNRTTPVTIIDDSMDGTIDEGRAMLQIVHDLAPGADLAFATAFGGIYAYADNIYRLYDEASADIIVDDFGYIVEPFFQDGPVSVAIQDVVNDGALYMTSVGNFHHTDSNGNSIGSYEAEAYRPTACPTVQFEGNPFTLGNDCHDFNTGSETDPLSGFTVPAGRTVTIALQWAEPWFGVETNLNLAIADEAGNVVASSTTTNQGDNGTQQPVESVTYSNQTGGEQNLNIVVSRLDSTATPRLKYIFLQASNLSTEYNATNSTDIFGPTVYGHFGETQALSIAGVPFNNSQIPEPFSSQGPMTVYFEPVFDDFPAAPLASPEVRQKPDVAATSGGQNTFFGSFDEQNQVYRFRGTSASAPHAAAVAALLKQRANEFDTPLDQARLERIFESSAAPIINGSPDLTGAGLIDAKSAMENVVATVVPTVACVIDNDDGTFTAFFGYDNPNDFDVVIPVGAANRFSGTTEDYGQMIYFEPGQAASEEEFDVTWDGATDLTWVLNGTTATASATNANTYCTE